MQIYAEYSSDSTLHFVHIMSSDPSNAPLRKNQTPSKFMVNLINNATYIGKGAQVRNREEVAERCQERVQKGPKDGNLSLTELSDQLLTFPSQQARNGKRGRQFFSYPRGEDLSLTELSAQL